MKTAPVDARIAFGFQGSVAASATTSASAPAASAVRASAPRFPGFSTPTATRYERRRRAARARHGRLDDREHALGLGAVAHLGEHARGHLLALRAPVGEQLGREVDRGDGEPGRQRALDLARPLGEEQARPAAAPVPIRKRKTSLTRGLSVDEITWRI